MNWVKRGRGLVHILYQAIPQLQIRYDPVTQMPVTPSLPVLAIPTTLLGNMPREASPSGKSGVGFASYSIAQQDIAQLQRVFILTDPDPIYKGEGKLITQGYVDPYVSRVRVSQTLGKKWTAG